MTLLTAVLSAIITTIIWYQKDSRNEMKTGTLSLMYWGASLMWAVDAIFEYAQLQNEYFKPSPTDMLNDLFLGICAVVFGLLLWLILVLYKDPKGVIKQALENIHN